MRPKRKFQTKPSRGRGVERIPLVLCPQKLLAAILTAQGNYSNGRKGAQRHRK